MKKINNPLKKMHKAIYPPPVKKGDTIGLVAPAGSLISKDNFTSGIKILEKKGFKVKFDQKLLNAKGYLAGSDQERADNFNKLWSDPEVKALVAARGGYGCLRMVDLIDMKRIRKTPKILIGFSDLTVLLNAIYKETGLITYHGPVVTTLSGNNTISQNSFFNTLLGKASPMPTPDEIRVLQEGIARGTLLGGNLTSLVHMIETPHEITWEDALLFIEDIGEKPYSLDRLLTHLSKTGRLGKIKGLILGTFTDERRKEKAILRKTVEVRINDLLIPGNIPIWSNFPSGHSRRNLTLPVGQQAEMDTSSNSLSIF